MLTVEVITDPAADSHPFRKAPGCCFYFLCDVRVSLLILFSSPSFADFYRT